MRAHAANLTRNNTKMLLEIKNIHMKGIKITKQLGFFVFFLHSMLQDTRGIYWGKIQQHLSYKLADNWLQR